jgi:hypothetical protein
MAVGSGQVSATIEERNRRMLRARALGHRDLLRRRLRQPRDVQRTFREIVGESPSAYRARFAAERGLRIPACWAMTWLRPAG